MTDAIQVDLTWSALLVKQCPYLKDMVVAEDGKISEEKLNVIMKGLHLEPCQGDDKHLCLERNCAALWKYYVERKHNQDRKLYKCAGILTDGKHYNAECDEAKLIASHLFAESKDGTFRPEDIGFLYDLSQVAKDQSEWKIRRHRGEATLSVRNKPNPSVITANETVRFLCVNHPKLYDYFIKIYGLRTGTTASQPSRRPFKPNTLYLLTESMDGNITQYAEHFRNRDPDYWNRLTRMMMHSLHGLWLLTNFGFSHGNVSKDNLFFTLDATGDQLVAVKWGNFDCLTPSYHENELCIEERYKDPLTLNKDQKQHLSADRFAFGIMIYELLYGEHPCEGLETHKKTWFSEYSKEESPIHDRILRLRAENNMQPLSTVAYHFIVNQLLFHDEKRWTFEHAFEYLRKHPIDKSVLRSLGCMHMEAIQIPMSDKW